MYLLLLNLYEEFGVHNAFHTVSARLLCTACGTLVPELRTASMPRQSERCALATHPAGSPPHHLLPYTFCAVRLTGSGAGSYFYTSNFMASAVTLPFCGSTLFPSDSDPFLDWLQQVLVFLQKRSKDAAFSFSAQRRTFPHIRGTP